MNIYRLGCVWQDNTIFLQNLKDRIRTELSVGFNHPPTSGPVADAPPDTASCATASAVFPDNTAADPPSSSAGSTNTPDIEFRESELFLSMRRRLACLEQRVTRLKQELAAYESLDVGDDEDEAQDEVAISQAQQEEEIGEELLQLVSKAGTIIIFNGFWTKFVISVHLLSINKYRRIYYTTPRRRYAVH